MKKEQHVDSLFARQGINVCFNGLGMTEELVNQFIYETQDIVDAEEQHRSMVVKHQLYERVLGRSLAKRQKYTGFEAFFDKDITCRIAIRGQNKPIVLSGGDTIMHGTKLTPSKTHSYIQMLAAELSQLNDIVLFLSGGIDSELIATVLIDNNIKFTPVIFRWLDQKGVARNDNDTMYAMRFCKQHGIAPDVRLMNIPELWSSEEFIQRSGDRGIVSAHISTYCEMVNAVTSDYPNATFVFGGEVRYKSNPLQFRDNPDLVGSNIVFATKQALPMIYNAWGTGRAIDTTATQSQLDTSSGRISQTYAPSGANGNFAFTGPRYVGFSKVQFMMIGGGGGGAGPSLGQSANSYHGGGGGGAGQTNYSGLSFDSVGEDIGYPGMKSGARFTGTVGAGGAGGAMGAAGSGGTATTLNITHVDSASYPPRNFSRAGGTGGSGPTGGMTYRYDGAVLPGGTSAGGAGFTTGGGGGAGSSDVGNSAYSMDGAMGGVGVTFRIDYAGVRTGSYTLSGGGGGGAGYADGVYGAPGASAYTEYQGPGTDWAMVAGPGPNYGASSGSPAGSLGVSNGWGGGGGSYGYTGGTGAHGGLHIAFG